jgi:aminoglycoside 3-N-acetyltransferase
MAEVDVIAHTTMPRTRASLTAELRSLGVSRGMTLIAHSSLSSLGWVSGNAQTVIDALLDAVTHEGTLVMPAHSANRTDPEKWKNPPVPPDWVPVIRETMPPYHPRVTPTYNIGVIPEVFRGVPEVRRSEHPTGSFAAWGMHASFITAVHPLDYPFGDASPLGRLYDLDGYVLLLGVGYDRNTVFHLGEYRALKGTQYETTDASAISRNGQRQWVAYKDIDSDSDFALLGQQFEDANPHAVVKGMVGSATARLIRVTEAVDFAKRALSPVALTVSL